MADNKIRVNTGIVIEVNDDGDTIRINAEDTGFIDGFYDLVEDMQKMADDARSAEVENLGDREKIKWTISETKKLMEKIDGLFGEDTCRKVFGDIVPSFFVLTEFFDQLIPITEKYADDRQKKITAKYNRNRKGGKHMTQTQKIQAAMGKTNV